MNDTISRQAAIDALKICDNNEDGINCHKCPLRDERWDGAWQDDETNCYRKLMRDSADLLSVQPKERCIATITLSGEDIERIVKEQVEEIKDSLPREGKWICQADDDIWNCSECDYEIDGTGCIDPLEYLKTYNFCPNCGCRMEEGDSDDN